jgi:hypothetical protein
MDDVNTVKALEPVIDYSIRIVGSGIELFGVVIIVTGIAWSTYRQLRQPISLQDSNVYKIRIGRSLLLGLEVFVAADIIKTVAHELTFLSGPARRPGAGSHVPQLDALAGDRGALALAARAITGARSAHRKHRTGVRRPRRERRLALFAPIMRARRHGPDRPCPPPVAYRRR